MTHSLVRLRTANLALATTGAAILAACLTGRGVVAAPLRADLCLTPLAQEEPLCNPALADSAWGTSHRASYAQASSPLPGPAGGGFVAEHLLLPGPPIAIDFSSKYPDGGRAVWGSPLGLDRSVLKLDHDTFQIVDVYIPAEREVDPPAGGLTITGAYNALDRDNRFIVGRVRSIEVFEDSVARDRWSPIQLTKREFLPDAIFCRATDTIAGMTMTYDGHVAFVTEQGVLGVIPRDPALMTPAHLVTASVNGGDCADTSIPDDALETVSNSLAADENGGIYLLTSAAQYKYHWDGAQLTQVWRAVYENDPNVSAIRLGPGSGSTPSLMGTDLDDDKLVVITDGQRIMHLVLMWRDAIPAGWQPIAPGKDPRIACEIPVTFGDPTATLSMSEQSVLVRGYSAVVVNNTIADESVFDGLPDFLISIVAALEGGDPRQAVPGLERFDWDPQTRTCKSVWANSKVRIPNSIPGMSASSGLIYGMGPDNRGRWGVLGVDFETGEQKFFMPAATVDCPPEASENIPGIILPFIQPILDRLPHSCENSLYAGTEVGPDGTIYTGAGQGISKYTPISVVQPPDRPQAVAGIGQTRDLARRGVAAIATNPERARNAIRQAQVQLDEAVAKLDTASTAGKIDAASATTANARLLSVRDHLASAEAALDTDTALAASELDAALSDLDAALDVVRPCPAAPEAGCRAAARSVLRLTEAGGAGDSLSWKWSRRDGTAPADLGDPANVTDYSICLYEGATSARIGESTVPSSTSKWRTSPRLKAYRDRDAAASGISKLRLKSHASTGKTAFLVKGRGPRLPPVSLPLALPVTMQFVNDQTGTCWEAVYDSQAVGRNDAQKFRATARE